MNAPAHRFLLLPLLLIFSSCALAAGGPSYLDLAPVANTAREDDGVANNGQGGWSDEGINDMGIYPPIPVGEVERNGQKFRLLDPAAHEGRAVVMLKGLKRGTGKPEQVELPVPGLKGAYLYVLQNSVGSVPGQPPEYRVATWTVQYADGTAAEIPMRSQVEIRPWWTGQWWDNHGRECWPVFIGRNFYSLKYNQYIGVWSTQWPNPHPEQPITNLVIRSAGLDAPVVWAVTLDDDDYYVPEETLKKDFVRPPGVPDGFFNARLEKERQAITAAGIAEGRLRGLRSVEVIRPDLLRVVVDSALGGIGAGSGAGVIEKLQAPETFSVSGSKVVAVGRHTYEAWRGDIGPFPANILFHHAFYLKLAAPLPAGRTCTVRVAGLEPPLTGELSLAFDPKQSESPAIKVNQAAYSGVATQRFAYLGWWAGDLGTVDFSDIGRYEVVEESGGRVVAGGAPVLRAESDARSGERVWELDLSGVRPGPAYHVRVPGLGRSATFAVGGAGVRDLYYHTSRAFFHQRCGQELQAPFSEFPRAACHLKVYEGGYLVGNPNYVPKPGEAVREFRGGYHDAADDDCFTYHLRATAQLLSVYEQYPGRFKDKDLNLPESGNGIPDVLDEAWWAVEFYLQNQREDGAILLGRGNDQDAMRDWERQHKSRPPFGNFPPTNMSCTEYAAVAAQLARLLKPFDARRAETLLRSADRAYAWAREHPSTPTELGEVLFQGWAAAELFRSSGSRRYNDDVLRLASTGAFKRVDWKLSHFATICKWSYASCDQPGTDAALRDELRASIKSSADHVLRHTSTNVYRVGHDGRAALGWGNGNGGGYYADVCLRTFWLTGDAAYLNVAALNADFQLGANPLSKGFITGLGVRPPVQPQINASLYREPRQTGETVKGITVYGLGNHQPPGYPAEVPLYRRWRDIGSSAEVCSEFTITETIGASAMLYAALYAEETGGARAPK